MGMMFKLALRNVFRNHRRSLITFSAVMIGIFSFIIVEGIQEALQNHSIRTLQKVDTAHLKIYARGYWDNRMKEPLKYRINDYSGLKKTVESLEGVKAATGRISFQIRLYKGRNELPCQGIAIDTGDSDRKVFNLKDSIIAGRYLTVGEQVLLGRELAELFDADVGSFVTVEFKDKNGIYDAIQAQVVGIVNTGYPSIDSGVVYFPLKLAQERLDTIGEVTELAILLRSERMLSKFKSNLDALFNNHKHFKAKYEILTWEEQASDFLVFMNTKTQGSYIVLYILVVIIIAGIMNTMLMSVFERVREIGTLMAMGMKGSMIKRMFLLEGGIIGGIGAVAGLLLGLIIMFFFSTGGLNLGALYGGQDIIYPVKDYIYGSIRFMPFLTAFLIGVVVAVFASYIPARSASRLHPAEALRRY